MMFHLSIIAHRTSAKVHSTSHCPAFQGTNCSGLKLRTATSFGEWMDGTSTKTGLLQRCRQRSEMAWGMHALGTSRWISKYSSNLSSCVFVCCAITFLHFPCFKAHSEVRILGNSYALPHLLLLPELCCCCLNEVWMCACSPEVSMLETYFSVWWYCEVMEL